MPAPGFEIGHRNLEAVRAYFETHLCATARECSKALGLSIMAVGRHVKTIRSEWANAVPADLRRATPRDLSNLGFDEALARFIQTDPKEAQDAADSVKKDDEEARRYVEERTDSIERGARRSRARFRL